MDERVRSPPEDPVPGLPELGGRRISKGQVSLPRVLRPDDADGVRLVHVVEAGVVASAQVGGAVGRRKEPTGRADLSGHVKPEGRRGGSDSHVPSVCQVRPGSRERPRSEPVDVRRIYLAPFGEVVSRVAAFPEDVGQDEADVSLRVRDPGRQGRVLRLDRRHGVADGERRGGRHGEERAKRGGGERPNWVPYRHGMGWLRIFLHGQVAIFFRFFKRETA